MFKQYFKIKFTLRIYFRNRNVIDTVVNTRNENFEFHRAPDHNPIHAFTEEIVCPCRELVPSCLKA